MSIVFEIFFKCFYSKIKLEFLSEVVYTLEVSKKYLSLCRENLFVMGSHISSYWVSNQLKWVDYNEVMKDGWGPITNRGIGIT